MTLTLLLASAASAQQEPSLALNRFAPAPAGDRFFGLSDAEASRHLQLEGALVLDYAHNPLVVEYIDTDGTTVVERIVSHQLYAHVGGAIGLWNFLKLDLSIPVVLYQSGQDPSFSGGDFTSPSGVAFGDIRFGARAQIFRQKDGLFALAAGGYLWVPSGAQGEGSFTSDGNVRGLPQVMVSGEIARFVYGYNIGVDLRRAQDYGGTTQGTRLQMSGAAGVLLGARKAWQIGPEANLGLTLKDISPETTNSELLLGVKWRFVPAFVAGLGGGLGIAGGAGTPDARVLGSITFSKKEQDRDKDGIFDGEDACPEVPGKTHSEPTLRGCPDTDGDGIFDLRDACIEQPGPFSASPATSGCPDRDGDGIVDREDACPAAPGARDEDPKQNGCPKDSDRDGIIDEQDACPEVSGVPDKDPGKNGCPSDRDGDGVLDEQDACPDHPGLKTEDPKTNGCADTDRDGIFDPEDACPAERGRPSDDPTQHGCPVVQVSTDKIVIFQKIQFGTGSAVIEAASFALLDDIAEVLREHSEIRRIEIQGHTDSRGSRWLNTKLSKDRAASVRAALLERGIDAGRLTSKGFGPTTPIATNDTDEGREKNRRVEFKILEQTQAAKAKQGEGQ